jgi:hypothetical protein
MGVLCLLGWRFIRVYSPRGRVGEFGVGDELEGRRCLSWTCVVIRFLSELPWRNVQLALNRGLHRLLDVPLWILRGSFVEI